MICVYFCYFFLLIALFLLFAVKPKYIYTYIPFVIHTNLTTNNHFTNHNQYIYLYNT